MSFDRPFTNGKTAYSTFHHTVPSAWTRLNFSRSEWKRYSSCHVRHLRIISIGPGHQLKRLAALLPKMPLSSQLSRRNPKVPTGLDAAAYTSKGLIQYYHQAQVHPFRDLTYREAGLHFGCLSSSTNFRSVLRILSSLYGTTGGKTSGMSNTWSSQKFGSPNSSLLKMIDGRPGLSADCL